MVCDNGCRRRQRQANQISDVTISKPNQQTSPVIGNLATLFLILGSFEQWYGGRCELSSGEQA
jgi:hypothetical protein